ncbi:MAG: hypothetical protein LJE94_05215 [Deltaproteobacteria bacterium]|nr:hypothetical protein [Deltaproteobacteria bacterium]
MAEDTDIKKDGQDESSDDGSSSDTRCCYVVDPCGCYVDPCGCYTSCCC